MSQVSPVNISNLSNISDLVRFLSPFCGQVQSALTNGLTVADNFQANIVGVTFPSSANTNIQIKHGLSTTPVGYFVIRYSIAGSVYDGTTPVLGAQFVNLKSNTANLFAQILFI